MREALRNVPQKDRPMPEGLVQARVTADTGALASADDPSGIFEVFMADKLPTGGVLGQGEGFMDSALPDGNGGAPAHGGGANNNDPLF